MYRWTQKTAQVFYDKKLLLFTIPYHDTHFTNKPYYKIYKRKITVLYYILPHRLWSFSFLEHTEGHSIPL